MPKVVEEPPDEDVERALLVPVDETETDETEATAALRVPLGADELERSLSLSRASIVVPENRPMLSIVISSCAAPKLAIQFGGVGRCFRAMRRARR